jgi:hypothetical protein
MEFSQFLLHKLMIEVSFFLVASSLRHHLIVRVLLVPWEIFQIIQKSFILFLIAVDLIFMIEGADAHLNLAFDPSVVDIDIESHDLLGISVEIVGSRMSVAKPFVVGIEIDKSGNI